MDRRQRSIPVEQNRQEDDHDLGNVTGDQVVDKLADIAVNDTTLLNSRNDGSVVVIGQDHIGSFFGNISTSDAHGNANISPLDGRSVIDTITGHCHHFTVVPQSVHDFHLVFRADTSIDIGDLDDLAHFFFSRIFNIGTGQYLVSRLQQTDIFGNRFRRVGIVTRDHDRTNTSILSFLESRLHLGSGGIDHTNQAHKNQVLFKIFSAQVSGHFGNWTVSNTQNAQGVAGHFVVRSQNFITHLLSQLDRVIMHIGFVAAKVQHHIRSALYCNGIPVGFLISYVRGNITVTRVKNVMDGDHTFAGGIEGDFLLARIVLVDHICSRACLEGSH